ncbi:hypothetical protein [Acinetobacter proteolyticus]|uniref:hypothetical protein n=1 Tax=Acinetobacter proteolyticus TaxID=1776741 RepID=UPI003D96C420
MLYNENVQIDIANLLQYVDSFTASIGLNQASIDTDKLVQVCLKMRKNFPCVNGLENASIFKRAAVFVSSFVEHGPIDLNSFLESGLQEDIKNKNPNAIIALNIAFEFMSYAKVKKTDGSVVTLNRGIKLSHHSYCDFLDMLSKDVSLSTHFMVLSLLFEQVVYKTHPDLQYAVINFSQDTEQDQLIYGSDLAIPQEPHPEWDDPIKFWWNDSK